MKKDKEKYNHFVSWFAQHPNKREPRSIKEFCDKYEITQSEIQKFKESSTFAADLIKKTKAWGKERIPELVHQLYELSTNTNNSKVIESFIDIIKDDENDKDADDIISITNFSDEQRKQIIDRIAGRGGFDRPRSKKEPTNV